MKRYYSLNFRIIPEAKVWYFCRNNRSPRHHVACLVTLSDPQTVVPCGMGPSLPFGAVCPVCFRSRTTVANLPPRLASGCDPDPCAWSTTDSTLWLIGTSPIGLLGEVPSVGLSWLGFWAVSLCWHSAHSPFKDARSAPSIAASSWQWTQRRCTSTTLPTQLRVVAVVLL